MQNESADTANTTCSFKDAVGSVCGPTSQAGSIIPLFRCENDLTEYLKKLEITERRGLGDSAVTEQEIILNRSGLFALTEHDTKQTVPDFAMARFRQS